MYLPQHLVGSIIVALKYVDMFNFMSSGSPVALDNAVFLSEPLQMFPLLPS